MTTSDVTGGEVARIDCIVALGAVRARIPGGAILGFARVRDGARVHKLGTARLLDWQGDIIPVVDLAAEFGGPATDLADGSLVVVRDAGTGGPRALLADGVDDIDEHAGVLDLPVPGCVADFDRVPAAVGPAAPADSPEVTAEEGAEEGATAYLVVTCAGTPYLVPLSDVLRVEDMPPGGLERCGSGLAAVLSGQLVRAVPLLGTVPGSVPGQALVLVGTGGATTALAVDALGDVVEPGAASRLAWLRDGIVDVFVVDGRAMGVVDTGHAVASTALGAARLAA